MDSVLPPDQSLQMHMKVEPSQLSTVNNKCIRQQDMWQLGNESWIPDDVNREGDVAICDWFTRSNPLLTHGSLDFPNVGMKSKCGR